MKIWSLKIDEARMTQFQLPVEEERIQFKEWIDYTLHTSESLSDVWIPPVLIKEKQKKNPDFFGLHSSGAVVLSVDGATTISMCMDDDDDYEFLPFSNEEQNYFLFNLLQYTDCLDKEESECDYLDNGIITEYESLIFDVTMLQGKPIFKIKELPHKIFVTSDFEYFYKLDKLKGLSFDEKEIVFIG